MGRASALYDAFKEGLTGFIVVIAQYANMNNHQEFLLSFTFNIMLPGLPLLKLCIHILLTDLFCFTLLESHFG